MREMNTRQFLAQHPLFAGLNAEQLDTIAQQAGSRSLARDEMLDLEGEPCTAVYLVMLGRLRVLKTSPQGREQIVAEMKPGETVYLVPALDGGPLPATTQAATRAAVVSFPCANFRQILRDYPSVSLQVLAEWAVRLRRLTSLVESLSLRTVPERLARFLLQLGQAESDRRLTQKEMAAQLGTVREVLARALAQFEREGWIRLGRGVIEVLDMEALRAVAGEDREL
ncbi:MAG: Crp/Fnr family transcriptional regulator [Anaerolineae bacterium]